MFSAKDRCRGTDHAFSTWSSRKNSERGSSRVKTEELSLSRPVSLRRGRRRVRTRKTRRARRDATRLAPNLSTKDGKKRREQRHGGTTSHLALPFVLLEHAVAYASRALHLTRPIRQDRLLGVPARGPSSARRVVEGGADHPQCARESASTHAWRAPSRSSFDANENVRRDRSPAEACTESGGAMRPAKKDRRGSF